MYTFIPGMLFRARALAAEAVAPSRDGLARWASPQGEPIYRSIYLSISISLSLSLYIYIYILRKVCKFKMPGIDRSSVELSPQRASQNRPGVCVCVCVTTRAVSWGQHIYPLSRGVSAGSEGKCLQAQKRYLYLSLSLSHIHMYMYIYIYIYMHIHMYNTYIYIYIYICTHTC